MKNVKVEVSLKTLLLFFGVLLGIWLFWELKNVFAVLFVSYILMSSLVPVVAFMEKKGLSRPLAILIPYLLVIFFGSVLLYFVIPPLVIESKHLISIIASRYQDFILIISPFTSGQPVQVPIDSLSELPAQAVKVGITTFNAFLSSISIIVLTFYMLLERDRLYSSFLFLFPINQREKTKLLLFRIEEKLGNWVRGEFILMCAVGFFCWAGLVLLGINYAFSLAIIAGFLEIIPIIGPIISAVPAILVGFGMSPLSAGLAALLYLLVQQTENHFLVPNVMKKSVNLNSVVVIVAIMVGGRLMGIWGSLLAVPAVAVAQIIVIHFISNSAYEQSSQE